MAVTAALLAAALVVVTGALAAPADMVGEWTFDGPTGIEDASGQANSATFVGVTRVPGRSGQAVRFDGVRSRVDFPESAVYGFSHDDTFTVELWLRTTRQDFCTPLMARRGGDVSFSFVLGRRPGCIAWELWSWGSVKLVSRTAIADGQWHHIVGVHDARTGNAALLVDGRLQAVARAGKGGPERTALRLGNNIGCDQYYSGEIDGLRISRSVPPEVQPALDRHARWLLLDPARLRQMHQAYLDRLAAPKNPSAKSPAQWQARRKALRRHVMHSLGLSPEPQRLPLNIHWGGKLDREGYTVQRLYWQTWQDYYTAGYLYLPKGLTSPAPAVLNPHGHWEYGNRNAVVQARMIGLARKGYVALTVDSVHEYDYYAGVTPLTVMMWNNIRALDLLCALPEVDRRRIGCTGCSGGAQQTFYLTAIEDRLAAAVPVCMVCEYRRILAIDSGHCPCNHVPGIAAETDQTEMAAGIAPKPTLFICVTQDWTSRFPREGYPETKALFDLHGRPEATGVFQHDWGHDYGRPMREQMYAWFNKWLKCIEDAEQAREAPFQPESLETLGKLDAPPSDAAGAEAVFAERRLSRAAPAFATNSAAGVRASGQRVRSDLARVFREGPMPPAAAEVLGRERVDGVAVARALVATEVDIRVPVLLILPPNRGGRRLPAVIITDPGGKAALASTHWDALTALARAGLAVALVDVRYVGEWSLNADTQRYNGILFGRPEAAVGAHDLVAVGWWLRTRPEIAPDRVAVVGLGQTGPLALMAAALDPRLAAVAAPDIGPTYAEGRTSPIASHLVTVGDLPDLAAACAPRRLWLGGVAEGKQWGVTRQAYERVGAKGGLQVSAPAVGLDDPALTAWLCGGAE